MGKWGYEVIRIQPNDAATYLKLSDTYIATRNQETDDTFISLCADKTGSQDKI